MYNPQRSAALCLNFLFLLICYTFCFTTVSGVDTPDEIALNGATFFWSQMLGMSSVKDMIFEAIQISMENIVKDSSVKIEIKKFNISGPQFHLFYTSNDPTKTKPEVFYGKHASQVTAKIGGLISWAGLKEYENLIPKDYYFNKVRMPPPEPVIPATFEVQQARLDIFLSGRYENWAQVVAKASTELTNAVRKSVWMSLYRLNVKVETEVEKFTPEPRSLVRDTKGSRAGLRMRLLITQKSHKSKVHIYDTFEASSLLLLMNCSRIKSVYMNYADPAEGSSEIYVMTVRRVPSEGKTIFEEYSILFTILALNVFVIMIIVLITITCCCCCCKARKPRTAKDQKKKMRDAV